MPGDALPHPPWVRALVALCALALFLGFVALGSWQVQRRAWKHELVARVEERVHAPAVAVPGPDQWPQVNAADDAYRHVRLSGMFLHAHEVLVQAVTVHGPGFWVLTPLRATDGTVLVNRGFVPPALRDPATRPVADPQAPVSVTGLLRLSEPGGGFLRRNDPQNGRWYSRDVQAIAAARGLGPVAPFFVDADAAPPQAGAAAPIGGLTVVQFTDHHLAYALTWYALALMVAAGTWHALRGGHGCARGHSARRAPPAG
ncbi:hypothetical protein B2J89_13690 [Acidovorax sp. SRB_24]|nr:hypothetical protein [Acidovorax sp. SRB_24]